MADLSEGALVLLSLIGAACILSILHVLATVVRDETHVHDLKRRVAELRDEQDREKRAAEEQAALGLPAAPAEDRAAA